MCKNQCTCKSNKHINIIQLIKIYMQCLMQQYIQYYHYKYMKYIYVCRISLSYCAYIFYFSIRKDI